MAIEERLTLRGPAKAAWARAGPVLAEHLAAPGLDPTKGWTLAGGTVLAARWGWHRASTDLDILVEPESRVTLWEMADVEGRLVKLDRALVALGWEPLHEEAGPWQRRYHSSEHRQQIDLFEGDLRPGLPAISAVIDGQPARIAHTSRILHGKIAGRGHRAPVRDLYDLACAERLDRDALAQALRHADPHAVATAASLLITNRPYYRDLAVRELAAATAPDIVRDPAARAAGALLRLLPVAWRVDKRREVWRLTALNIHDEQIGSFRTTLESWTTNRVAVEAHTGSAGGMVLDATPAGAARNVTDAKLKKRVAELHLELEGLPHLDGSERKRERC